VPATPSAAAHEQLPKDRPDAAANEATAGQMKAYNQKGSADHDAHGLPASSDDCCLPQCLLQSADLSVLGGRWNAKVDLFFLLAPFSDCSCQYM